MKKSIYLLKSGMFFLFLALSFFSFCQNDTNAIHTIGNVGIGIANPTSKFQVSGKATFDSIVVAKDTLRAKENIIAEKELKVNGDLFINGKIHAWKIVTDNPNGEIHLGDSSLIYDDNNNQLRVNASINNTGPLNVKCNGLGFGGNLTYAYGSKSHVFGETAYTGQSAAYSVLIGRGITNVQGSTYMTLTTQNTFAVGFNSDVPTLFVGNSAGVGTTGEVSIGTIPVTTAKLTVKQNTTTNYKYAINAVTNNPLTKCFAAYDESTSTENFIVYGNGKVYAREVHVKLGVLGDFVFEPNYQLMPLNQLEQYLKTNKHLPNIPSEAEVKKNDLNVGEMQALQLQKIEELTLYVIEVNKKVEALQKENAELKAKIDSPEKN